MHGYFHGIQFPMNRYIIMQLQLDTSNFQLSTSYAWSRAYIASKVDLK